MNNATVIVLTGIQDQVTLHTLLKEAFGFPDYYGGNLDALYDMLTSLSEPRHLIIYGEDDPEPGMKTYIPKFLRVLEDAAEENPLFTFEIRHHSRIYDRKPLVVCGSWEDAENLNMFLNNLNIPEITSRYVVCCFSFGTNNDGKHHTRTQIELKLAEIIMKLEPAGIIIFAEMLKAPMTCERLADIGHEHNIPVFMLEHDGDDCINFKLDYTSGFRGLVRHIIEDHGITDLMMVAGYKGNPFSEDRIKVFKEELRAHNLPVDSNRIIYGNFWYVPASHALSEYLENNGGKVPGAIICANDTMAMGCCDLLVSRGYRVPEDVIITGFDGIKDALCHFPTITTAAPDYSEVARLISSTMNDWDPTQPAKTIEYTIPYKLLLKHSCGCNDTTWEEMRDISSTLFRDNQDYFMHVHEMGRLTSTAITIADTKLLAAFLDQHLWLWKDQMFFVGLTESESCINAIYSSWKENYEYGNKIYNPVTILPYLDEVLAYGSNINFLLFSQLRSLDEAYGYLCTGSSNVPLRLQQRFEEMESYVSSIVHSVLNNNKLMRVNREMKALSEMDYMTGLYNRRGFLSRVAAIVKDPRNRNKVFNYIMMDLDNLKPINDNYGHQEGDVVIKALAYAIQTRVHKTGISSRFGGDEFAFVILSDSPLDDEADDLRHRIEESAQNDSSIISKPYKILASIGIASCPVSDFPSGRIDSVLERLMNAADERMYADKQKRHQR